MLKADLESFDKKNYYVEYKKLTKINGEKAVDKRSTVCTVKKLRKVNSTLFDIGVYEQNLRIDSYDNFQRKIEESLLDILFLRIDKNFNLYKVLNKDLIYKKLKIIKEMSENIDFLEMDFSILKIEKILENDDYLNFVIRKYKFYDCFFSEIYTGFYKNLRGFLKGNEYVTDLMPNITIPLNLKLEETGLRKYQITGELDTIKLSELNFCEQIMKKTGLNITKIELFYKNDIEMDENNIIRNSKKKFILEADNKFLHGREINIKEEV